MKKTSLRIAAGVATVSLALAGLAAFALADAPESEYTGSLTEDDIELYCGMCHFTNVENQNISTFNVETCNRAMVESMVPMLDDETIDDLTAYFAAIPVVSDEA